MSVIKIGNKVVQSGSSGYQPKGVKKNTSTKKIKEVKGGDARGNYLTNQAFRQQQADDRAMQAAMTNRASIKSMAGKGFINPADFKGGAARLPGESGEDYRKFMVGLRSLNTGAFDKAFPFSSGSAIRNVSRLMPGMGVVSLMQKAFGKGKDMAGGAFDKVAGSGIMQNFKGAGSGFLGDLSTMFRDLTGIGKGKGATTEVKPQSFPTPEDPKINYVDPIMQMAASLKDNIFTGVTPTDPDPRIFTGATPTDPDPRIFTGATPTDPDPRIVPKQKPPPPSDFTGETPSGPPMIPSAPDFVNNPITGQVVINGQGMVYSDGSPVMEEGPTPLFPSEVLDEKTMQDAIDGVLQTNVPGMAMGGSMGNFNLLKATNDEMHG